MVNHFFLLQHSVVTLKSGIYYSIYDFFWSNWSGNPVSICLPLLLIPSIFFVCAEWFRVGLVKTQRCRCGCGSLRMWMVVISSVIRRYVGLVEQLEICVFMRYLWLVDYEILHRFSNKLPILTYYNIIRISKYTIVIKYNNYYRIEILIILCLFIYFLNLDESYNFYKICFEYLYWNFKRILCFVYICIYLYIVYILMLKNLVIFLV